ncbi:hypothetical protein [Paenibacillus typhae]|uniref:hypothetical protein n=1 Tax=Paenibacillus typhae TaxID=1174501 RepID=UPI001C8EA054|nr:hypothetical protein [Paenibacillus typhae]MBY0010855.1 hypothetical protein [Paenibacillus typhae]
MSKHHKRKNYNKGSLKKKTTAIIYLTMMLTPQVAQYAQIARSAPQVAPVKKITIPSNQKVQLNLDQDYSYKAPDYNSNVIKVSTKSGNSLSIEPLKEGSTFLTLELSNSHNTVVQSFVIDVVDAGIDGIIDVGDIVNYLNIFPSSAVVTDVRKMLENIEPRFVSADSNNQSPEALSQPLVIFDPNQQKFVQTYSDLSHLFTDPDGDYLSYSIVEAPGFNSGLTLSLNGGMLTIGGTPTLPTAFTVRATDPGGLYADLRSTLNFVPEPLSHAVTYANGNLTQIHLGDYFTDRDHDKLSFSYEQSQMHNPLIHSWLDENILNISGPISGPLDIHISATDGNGWWAHNNVHIIGNTIPKDNLAPIALSQAVIIFDPAQKSFAQIPRSLDDFFKDPDGDFLSYSIVQGPDPFSGLSLSVNNNTLSIGGTPTAPTSFTIRATDPYGHYAETQGRLNFVPEAISHDAVAATGLLTLLDLNEYFMDRDHDALSFSLGGIGYSSNGISAWIDGNVLSVSGAILHPMQLQVTATDVQGWSAQNNIYINGAEVTDENLAPVAVSQPLFVYDSNKEGFVRGFALLNTFFKDPDGDMLSYSIVQGPDADSGLQLTLGGIHNYYLIFGGTPTKPASFIIRGTDPQGLYAETIGTLNFVPEAVSHAVVQASGLLTQLDLNEYFLDRDHEALSFSLGSIAQAGNAISAWIEDSSLFISGAIAHPQEIYIYATDGHGRYAYNTAHIIGENLAPVALSQPMIIFDSFYNGFVKSLTGMDMYFQDPNGDSLSYSIVQGPDPLSGLSLSLFNNQLYVGGTPTAPTSFTIRATDPRGLYADMETTLNFVPEAVSHAVTEATGLLTQLDLNEYFIDRDHEALSFSLSGIGYTSNAIDAWVDGNILSISGAIIQPQELYISATDGHGWAAYNTLQVVGENLAPVALSQPMVIFDPAYNGFVKSLAGMDMYFQDPNGDSLSYSIVQGPDPLSGLSLQFYEGWNGVYLNLSGVPTMPTAFTIRATDPRGLYADMETTLNFVPEAVSHAVAEATGLLTQLDLNEYFIDRDHEALSFSIGGIGYTSNAIDAWVDGNILSISGALIQPQELYISATDGHGWAAYNTLQVVGENLAPVALSQPMVIFDPAYNGFVKSLAGMDMYFQDPNGDSLSYSIVQGPDPLSGLSLSLFNNQLYVGGTPTAPTSFTIRATDPRGLYADMETTLNFVPEAISHAVAEATGLLTQVDLNEYFIDRDHEALSFSIGGIVYTSNAINAWVDGNILSISGTIIQPQELYISATDGHGWAAYNTLQVVGENLAPVALSQPMVIFNPAYNGFVKSLTGMDMYFQDPNGDSLSYSIVQGPDPLSGLSLSLFNNQLYVGGTPTAPTSFTIRATDPRGLYADMETTLNFVPEAVSHAVAEATGMLTQLDLNEYFVDRDHEALSFSIGGIGYTSNAIDAWVDGNILSISGAIIQPQELYISATDGHGWAAYNTLQVVGENLAPIANSQSMVIFNPTDGHFVQTLSALNTYFQDPNGDSLSYSIVQGPDPLSGLSLQFYDGWNGVYLNLSGVPTMPTAFTIRATDPRGLYADMETTLNFVPEAVSHAVTEATGLLTQLDLNEYFIDRDHETLSFSLGGIGYTSNAIDAWVDGNILSISGAIIQPQELYISATDGHGWAAYNTLQVVGENLAPVALSQPMVIFDPAYNGFVKSLTGMDMYFQDPNGDSLSYSIVQGPDPLSGLSLQFYDGWNGMYLNLSGVPTMPTAFTIRATDPRGLYADMETTLNFVPEAVSHAVAEATGLLTQVDLNEYFIDRDHEALSFSIGGIGYTSNAIDAWVDGNILSISGAIIQPQELYISATDGHGWAAYNTLQVVGENLAPVALSQPMVIFDPAYNGFVKSLAGMDMYFQDPNGDSLSYSIVQGPDPLSGLSLQFYEGWNGVYLNLSGVPTIPTAFTIRATDPRGLYADMETTLNFVPEAVSHAVAEATGLLTQLDLNEYFIDRDHEALSFSIGGIGYTSNAINAWVDGNILSISGAIIQPQELYISATDGHGWAAYNTLQVVGENLAPIANSQSMVIFNPTDGHFVQTLSALNTYFQDPNGDSLSYSIVQGPDPLSGLSLQFYEGWNGVYLNLSGVPTIPTAFTIRATDPRGLYADMETTLNFVPEAVSHAVAEATGLLTQLDLNEYFIDRDHEALSFSIGGIGYTSNAIDAWVDGNILSISGAIIQPQELYISATDGHGWAAYNTARIAGENVAPLTLSKPMVIYDPYEGQFVQTLGNLNEYFQDPNKDTLSYSIVQGPDPLSGLSLSVYNNQLVSAGTPTAPTTFIIRATDPNGLYTEAQGALYFVPEAATHPVVRATGVVTELNLSDYFVDQGRGPLSYSIGVGWMGNYISVVPDGEILSIFGAIVQPQRIYITARDNYGWFSHIFVLLVGENVAPLAISQPIVNFDWSKGQFIHDTAAMHSIFEDPNGDNLSYAIVQGPDPLSGLSLSIKTGAYDLLAFGATPTAPTTFTIRATDPYGLYAETQGMLNFVPEAVSHAVVKTTGFLTQLDLNQYFVDRDHEALSFTLSGIGNTSNTINAWVDGNILSISGAIIRPQELYISATDGHGWEAYNTVQVIGENLAPVANSQSMVIFNPIDGNFVQTLSALNMYFQDPDGDSLSYSIVQEPDPLSGLSLSLYDNQLYIGGTPTAPTSFTIRATDPQGLYTDMETMLNFVPESVSHADVEATGFLTQLDLNEYFIDRDNEALSFTLGGFSYTSYPISAWVDGHILSISGAITQPVDFYLYATDGHGWYNYNTAMVIGGPAVSDNHAPLLTSQPMVIFDPLQGHFYHNFNDLDALFQDPDGDLLSYSIVQGPDPLSGLSLSLQNNNLSIGGSPTMPASFTIRATDPHGLYFDVESTLNFVPEAVSHSVIQISGALNHVNLNEYFTDRNNDFLTYILNGDGGYNVWIEGGILSVSGIINAPLILTVTAIDGQGWTATNYVELRSASYDHN